VQKRKAALDFLSAVCSDAFSNLRGALDFAYWQVVSPHVADEKHRKNIQFPFCKHLMKVGNDDGLEETILKRHADKVSSAFCDVIRSLRPYGGAEGNTLLYLLERASIPERHRDYTPVANFKQVEASTLKSQIQDFPQCVYGTLAFGRGFRDIEWDAGRIDVRKRHIGSLVPGSFVVFERELDVPVEVIFDIPEADYRRPVVQTLADVSKAVAETLGLLEPFA
jgi:hypothetical protein